METLQSREEIIEAFRTVLVRFENLVRPLTGE